MGKAAEGIITIGHWMPRDDWKGSKAFFDAYKKKYNELPDYLDSALAYMSLEMLEQAVAKAGLDREKLRQTIATDTFETINGKVKFEGVQNAITPTAFLQFQNGKSAAGVAAVDRIGQGQTEKRLGLIASFKGGGSYFEPSP